MSTSPSGAVGPGAWHGYLFPSGFPTSWWGLGQINSRIRLVRLRPEFAHLYPGLDPGVWETATDLASRLLAQHPLPSPGFMLTNRVLPEEHFEFQGGDSPGHLVRTGRSRMND